MANVQVKICGLSTPDHVRWAVEAGARYLGFVFFPKSPRNVDIATAAALAVEVPPGIAKVALVVNADDAALDAILARVPVDMLQLHGSETPARVAEILPLLPPEVAEAALLRRLDPNDPRTPHDRSPRARVADVLRYFPHVWTPRLAVECALPGLRGSVKFRTKHG